MAWHPQHERLFASGGAKVGVDVDVDDDGGGGDGIDKDGVCLNLDSVCSFKLGLGVWRC